MTEFSFSERTKQFHELVKRPLAELGLKKSGYDYSISLTPGATGFLFPTAVPRRSPGGTALEVFCNVAIRHERLQELLRELTNRCGDKNKYKKNFDMSTHIGYLLPKRTYTPWLFGPGDDMAGGAMEFVDCVEQYALPYMRANTSLDAVEEEFRSKPKIPEYRYIYPAALHLLGRQGDALLVLDKCIENERAENVRYSAVKHIYDDRIVTERRKLPPDQERFRKYREFADRLRAKIEDARPGH